MKSSLLKYGLFLIVLSWSFNLQGQEVVIADALPGCLDNTITKEGQGCGGGTTTFDIVNNQFVVQNVDGIDCCPSFGGDGRTYFQFETVDISNYSNVSVSIEYSAADTPYEDDSPDGNPVFQCYDTNPPDNSHDQIVFWYSIDGGPFIQSLYVHGITQADFTGTWNAGTFNGNTLTIKVNAANKATAEIFYFENLQIKGTSILSAGPDLSVCSGDPIPLQGSGNGIWSGGSGTFSNPNSPTSTYTPASFEAGTSVTLTFTGHPVSSSCDDNLFDQMIVTVNADDIASFSMDDFCGTTSGAPTFIDPLGGTFSFDPNPGDGAIIDPSTGIITNAVGGNNYTVKYTTSGICPGETTQTVSSNIGPEILGNQSATLCKGLCAVLDLNPSGGVAPYSFNTNLSIPGYSNNFIFNDIYIGNSITICYNDNQGTNVTVNGNTITIPTTFVGLGSFDIIGIEDAGGCQGTSSYHFDLELSEGPDVVSAGPLTECGDENGFAVFNLSSLNSIITGGASSVIVQWFLDANGLQSITNPSSYTSGTGTVYVQVTDIDGLCKSQIIPINLIVEQSDDFLQMYCSSNLSTNCSICGNTSFVDFFFSFTTNDNYTVTVRDLSSLVDYTQTVSNFLPMTNIPIYGSSTFEVISIESQNGCSGFIPAGSTVTITLTDPPVFNPIPDISSCSFVILPPITGQNLSGFEAYYTGHNGFGAIYYPGNLVTTSQTLYIYDNQTDCPGDEIAVEIIIESPPIFDPITINPSCSSIILPQIFGQNLSSFQAYYTGHNGTGQIFYPGEVITSSMTLYVYDSQSSCSSDEIEVNIVIESPVSFDPIIIPETCLPVTLPQIFGQNLSGYEAYYTGQNGTGTIYHGGDIIYSSQTLYVFDNYSACSDEIAVAITINASVSFDPISDIEACEGETITLPQVTGIGFSGNVYFCTNPDGSGTVYNTGDDIGESLILYAFDPDADPDCVNVSAPFQVIIHDLPALAVISPINCNQDSEGSFSITSPIGSQYSYSIDGGAFQYTPDFVDIAEGNHSIIVRNNDSGCENSAFIFDIDCDCTDPDLITLPRYSDAICVGDSYLLDSVMVLGIVNSYTIGVINGDGILLPGFDEVLNYTYISDEDDAGKIIQIVFIIDEPSGGTCAPLTVTFELQVNERPHVDISGQDLVCPGSDLEWVASGGVSYLWSNGNDTDILQLNDVSEAAIYTVTVTDANGCIDSLSKTLDIIQFTAGADVSASFCNVNPIFINLNDYLSSDAEPGGVWEDDADVIVNPDNFEVTALSLGEHSLYYIVENAACGIDTAIMTVDLREMSHAGTNYTGFRCLDESVSVNLSSLLGGHDSGGNWRVEPEGIVDLSNPEDVNLFDVGPQKYTFYYVIPDTGCGADSAYVKIETVEREDAGEHVIYETCVGAVVDLFDLILTDDKSGEFLNRMGYDGLTGSVWNSEGFDPYAYLFEYVLHGTIPCASDTTLIFIVLNPSVTAGEDVSASFCPGQIVDLNLLLDPDANLGGIFMTHGEEIVDGLLQTSDQNSQYVVTYQVGGDDNCLISTANITLNAFIRPEISLIELPDVCAGQCVDLVIHSEFEQGSIYYLTALNYVTGETYHGEIAQGTSGFGVINICSSSVPPYAINTWPENFMAIINIDSVQSSTAEGCVFNFDIQTTFNSQNPEEKTLEPVICRGDTFVFGGETFSESHPSGTVIIPSALQGSCDTIYTVNLDFYTVSEGYFETTVCNKNEVFNIGGQEFTFDNPSGDVVLTGASIHGCDSLVHVQIHYNSDAVEGQTTYTVCNDDFEVVVEGVVFNKDNPKGSVLIEGGSVNGCDSLTFVEIVFRDFKVGYDLIFECDQPTILKLIRPETSDPGPYDVFLNGDMFGADIILPLKLTLIDGLNEVSVITDQGCVFDLEVDVPAAGSEPDVRLSQSPRDDGGIQLNAIISSGSISEWMWTPSGTLSCSDCLEPISFPTATTIYIFEYTYGYGCRDSKTITVEKIHTTVGIPNIFSPNNDNRNDKFFVTYPDKVRGIIKGMNVYDRWGNLMFTASDIEPNNPNVGWDGTFKGSDAQPGVYTYMIEAFFDNDGTSKIYTGTITLIR